MWCSDPLLNLLKSYGYCTIRLPKADVKPLQILFTAVDRSLDPIHETRSSVLARTRRPQER